MKSINLLIGLAFVSSVASAQTGYDVQRLTENELNGTARFVGMGGAMGALGADISVIGTNPAGIALFRRNDVSTTFGFNTTMVKSDFAGTSMKEKKTKASFDQAGFVYSMKIGNRTNLRYVNFGFNYHKSSNFNKLFSAGGLLDGLSQTNQIAFMMEDSFLANGIGDMGSAMDKIYDYELGASGSNPYTSYEQYPYLGVMGVRSELVTKGTYTDDKNVEHEVPFGWNGDQNYYFSREEGGIYQYDFNASFNIQDKMYFGLTVGVQDVDYKRFTSYSEDISWGDDRGFYELQNVMSTEGTGVNVKLGAIFRPIDDSPFRFGFAIHTPTWFELTDVYDSNIHSELDYKLEDGGVDKVTIDEYLSDYVGGETLQDYKLVTPWKFNVNMGTVFAGVMAVGAEYEYTDYSSSKLRYVDGYDMDNQNQIMKEDMKGVHTLRLGMETKLTNAFSLRAGYNYSSSIFKDSAYKALNLNDMRTDVDFNNKYEQHTATIGLGYRGKIFYFDAAYKYNTYKSDFYAFSDEALQATKLNNERHQALFTLGARF